MKKYFDILGLPEGASQEAIQEAYDRLSKELDPVNNNNQEFFVEEYEKLQEAYNALSNSTILKSSEKSYVNSNVEEAPQVEQKKTNNDSITITISPEKIEELKRNAKQNNNGSPNEKFFAKKNSLSRLFENSTTARLLEICDIPVEVVTGKALPALERWGIPALGAGAATALMAVVID